MKRSACIIAAGVWGGKRSLLKNRDRKYTPKVTIVREVLDGTEVAYMRDSVTDWCEGLNEHGIGITNAALAVGLDEAEGTDERHRTNNKSDDGKRMLKALGCKTLDDAIKSICEYKKGLEGHTFASDTKRAVSIELVGDQCVVRDLDPEDIHVRTNHGRDTGGTGYTDGEGYLASAARKEKAIQILRQSKKPTDLGPDLMANRSEKEPHTLNDPVRDAKKMKTTSQMVLNLTDRELDFFVLPDRMEYKGLEDRLPRGHKPKIKVRVFSYQNDGAKMVEINPETGDPQGKPKKVASAHDKSIALMKFLSGVARREGVAEHVYVVGGAVRNYILGVPIKDIDVVVDSVNLGRGRDSAWFARKVVAAIPVPANLTTNQYGVAIITVKGDWDLDGIPMKGEVIEIANARKESYEGAGGKGKGYKPTDVSPATITEDVYRREFTFNCMTGDTLIPTEMGILRIDEIASQSDGDHQGIQLQVAGRNGPATAVGWQYSGFTDTLRVRTTWGHYFTCTHHHPVLVLRGHDYAWVQADHLTPGDLLCVPVRQVVRKTPLVINLPDPVSPDRGGLKDVQKPGMMTPELAFILGCLVAEGSNTYKRVSFSNGDLALISRYSGYFYAVFGIMPSRNRVVEKGTVRTLKGVDFVANRDCFDIYADSKTVVGWLDHLGLYCDGTKDGTTASHHKVIPWSVLGADEQCQWAFIAAYLEGDGSIRPNSGRMAFRSVSPHIRHQLQVLLGAHGILSKIDGDFVHVNAVDAALLWGKIHPWMVTKGFDYGTATFKSRNRYGIPVEFLSGFLSGRKVRSYGKRGVGYRNDDGEEVVVQGMGESLHNIKRFLYDAYGRGDFQTLLDGLQKISSVEHTKFKGLLDLGYQYVEVASVTDAGKQYVYDISMNEGVEPAFVANGVVVHNTLLWRLLDLANGPEKAEIIDITGLGRQHLEEKLIQTPLDPDKTFSDDPTRQLRILKFLLRYNLKIAPEVVASVRRNAHKLKDMPWEAVGNLLVDSILASPRASQGLKVMKDLGILDVLVEMVQDTPAFEAYLTRQLANGNHTMGLLLELADLGIAGRVVTFLSPDQRERFREVTMGLDDAEARRYLEALRKPSVDSLALIQEFDIQGRDRGVLVPMAREILLGEPDTVRNDVKLNDRLREHLRERFSRVTASEAPMTTSAHRVASRYVQATAPKTVILSEVENLEALVADIQVVLDTFENTVPMPHLGRVAALTLVSQQECLAKCEHALKHCERVINMARDYLLYNHGPEDTKVAEAMRDAQDMYEKFESFRARSREMLSAMSQKIMPTEIKNAVTAVVDGVRKALNFPNSVTVVVAPRFTPCPVNGRMVEGLVFFAYVTAYPLPKDENPYWQQFVFTQATMGDDLNLYMGAEDRQTGEPTKPVIVGADTDALVKKVLGMLKGWTNLKG